MTILTRDYYHRPSFTTLLKKEQHLQDNYKGHSRRIKVNCMASRHTIILKANGRLSFPDHKEGFDNIGTLLAFDPALRCRCLEVRMLWGEIPKHLNLSSFLRATFGDGYGRVQGDGDLSVLGWEWLSYNYDRYVLTPSKVAALLPKRLQAPLENCWQLADMRRYIASEQPPLETRPASIRYTDSDKEGHLVNRLQRVHHTYMCDPAKCDGSTYNGGGCGAPTNPIGISIRDYIRDCSVTPWRMSALRAGYVPTHWNAEDKAEGWFLGTHKSCMNRGYYARKQAMVKYHQDPYTGKYVFTKVRTYKSH